MKSPIAAKLLRIYISENDRSGGKPLYVALTNVLKQNGIARVIVIRGKIGYGSSGLIKGDHFWPFPGDFPIIVECIDSAEKVLKVLPTINRMITIGTCIVIDGQIWG